jgi:hypothetical protein
MKKIFLPVLTVVTLLFTAWMAQRNQIWENGQLSPSETVLKFLQGRAFFVMALRAAALLLWGWGVFVLWKFKLSRYVWWAAIFYVVFNCLEFILLEEYFFEYKMQHGLWEGGFAVSWLLAFFVGATVLVFNAFAVWLIRYWHRKNTEPLG